MSPPSQKHTFSLQIHLFTQVILIQVLPSQPQVSIIIPFYNAQDFISRALDSALIQSYENINIILVDDGSTDNTSKVLQHYLSDPKVQYYPLVTNRGTLYARCFGISKASELTVFLDADDELTPGCVSNTVRAMQERNVDLVIFGTNKSTNDRNYHRDEPQEFFSEVSSGERLLQNIYSEGQKRIYWILWGKLFRTSQLLEAVKRINILMVNRIVFSEDLLIFVALLAQDPKAIGINFVGYVQHVTEQSVTQAPTYNGGGQTFKKHLMQLFSSYHACILYREICSKLGSKIDMESRITMNSTPMNDDCENQIELVLEFSRHTNDTFYQIFAQFAKMYDMYYPECRKSIMKWTTQMKQHQFVEHWNGLNPNSIYLQNKTSDEIMQLAEIILNNISVGYDIQEGQVTQQSITPQSNAKQNMDDSQQTLMIGLCSKPSDEPQTIPNQLWFTRIGEFIQSVVEQQKQLSSYQKYKIIAFNEMSSSYCDIFLKLMRDKFKGTEFDVQCLGKYQDNKYEVLTNASHVVALRDECLWKYKMYVNALGRDVLLLD